MHSVQQHYTYGEKSDHVIPAKAGIQICIVSTKYFNQILKIFSNFCCQYT